jgi:hypothetical protein
MPDDLFDEAFRFGGLPPPPRLWRAGWRRVRRLVPALPAVLLLVAAGAALGHGDAAWIQHEPAYKAANGVHCCGQNDCTRLPDGAVLEADDGWFVTLPDRAAPQFIRRTARGVYPSRTGDYWACRHPASPIRCFFYPVPGV